MPQHSYIQTRFRARESHETVIEEDARSMLERQLAASRFTDVE